MNSLFITILVMHVFMAFYTYGWIQRNLYQPNKVELYFYPLVWPMFWVVALFWLAVFWLMEE